METLFKLLNSIYPLSEPLKEYLLLNLQVRELGKKDILLKAGHICRSIYFIESGLLRCYYLQHDHEVCSWFMKEGDIIVSVESFFEQKESQEYIQAIENSVLHYISFGKLEYIYRNFLEFNYIGRVLLQQYYKQSEQRLYSIRMQRGPDRFEYLQKNHPDLIKRVEQKQLASYLGISEQYLCMLKGTGKQKKRLIS